MTPARPKQQLPADIATDLMNYIRGHFYASATQKQWFQDSKFLMREVVTWPARWLNSRGVTLPPERYCKILLEVFRTIENHGQTDAIKYWPGYLKKCVQDHFAHHGESYYEEGKAIRSKLDIALSTCRSAVQRQPDPIRTLAEVHHVLATATPRRRKTAPKSPRQLDLF